jgi:hypothetical protein
VRYAPEVAARLEAAYQARQAAVDLGEGRHADLSDRQRMRQVVTAARWRSRPIWRRVPVGVL